MKRSEGERVRLKHSLERMRAQVSDVEMGLKAGGPVGAEAAGAMVQTAIEVAMQIAKLDAFELAERDTRAEAQGRCPECNWPMEGGRHGSPDGVACPRGKRE